MKKLYMFILMLAAAVGINAQTQSTCLTLNFTNGTVAKFAIPKKPVVTFSGEELVVKTSLDLTASYPVADVETFNFTEGTTASVNAIAGDKTYNVEFIGNSEIVITGQNLTGANVYSVSGAHVASAKANAGVVSVDLSALPSGIYLIEVPGFSSMKIQK